MTIAVSNLKKEMNIYEDEKAMVYLHEHPCAPGHLVVFPKQDTSSLENLDAETFAHLTTVASFASFGAVLPTAALPNIAQYFNISQAF